MPETSCPVALHRHMATVDEGDQRLQGRLKISKVRIYRRILSETFKFYGLPCTIG